MSVTTPFEEHPEQWSTYEEEIDFLDSIVDGYKLRKTQVSTSVEERAIYRYSFGNPEAEQTVYIVCSQHGDEPAPREAAMAFLRDYSEDLLDLPNDYLSKTEIKIVVNPNPDRTGQTRNNADDVNINRSWGINRTAETEGIIDDIESKPIHLLVDSHEGGIGGWVDDFLLVYNGRDRLEHPPRFKLGARLYSRIHRDVSDLGSKVGIFGSHLPTGQGVTLYSRWIYYNCVALLLEGYQNESNSINLPVPPTRRFDLRVADNHQAYKSIIQVHKDFYEDFGLAKEPYEEEAVSVSSFSPLVPEDLSNSLYVNMDNLNHRV